MHTTENLNLFYQKYNFKRIHASIAYLAPQIFWRVWNLGYVNKSIDKHNRKIKFKLKIPYHMVKDCSGKQEPKRSILHSQQREDNKMNSAESSNDFRYKQSPVVASCNSNLDLFEYISKNQM